MSSLLRKRNPQGRPAPGRMALGALVAVGLLSTVVSLTAAGTGGSASTASLTTAAASTSASQRSVASGTSAVTSATQAKSAGSMSGAMSTSTTKTVEIKNYAFSPAALTVNVGDTVTWTNMDTAPHTVTVTSGPVKFNSGNLSTGQSFSYTFTTAGTYSYYCAVHPDMVAKVVVNGSGTTPTPTPTPVPTPTPTMPMPAPGCEGLQAAVDAFMQHFYSAHLETSVGQQLSDALNVDQYTKTHTVLIENMLKPLRGGAQSSLDVFLQHLYAAHLETSPGQQAQDALNFNQYVKTHTVMIENMIKPLAGQDVSDC
jgi:plastocyanin